MHTITADNGKEFTGHAEVAAALGLDYYFARPYHSWERGLSEHTNGLARQYWPKWKEFKHLPPEEVRRVQELLNNRPRARRWATGRRPRRSKPGKDTSQAWHTGARKRAKREECATRRARAWRNVPERAVESEKTDDSPGLGSNRTADPLSEMLG